jgi:hypothetical protein
MNFRQPDVYDNHMTFQSERTYVSKLLKNRLPGLGRLLRPDIVHFHFTHLGTEIFSGTNTFEHAEFKSEKFPLRRPAVFSQTAILSSLISRQLFSLFNDTDR